MFDLLQTACRLLLRNASPGGNVACARTRIRDAANLTGKLERERRACRPCGALRAAL